MGADMSVAELTLWAETLRSFNARNLSRSMDLEILTVALGAQAEVRGMTLNGVAYDHHDGRVQVMLGAGGLSHITHSIDDVTSIDMLTADKPSQDVLRITNKDGESILTATRPATVAAGDSCCVSRTPA